MKTVTKVNLDFYDENVVTHEGLDIYDEGLDVYDETEKKSL